MYLILVLSPKTVKQSWMLFPNFYVKFIGRQANVVAHTLAMAAANNASPYFIFLLLIVLQGISVDSAHVFKVI